MTNVTTRSSNSRLPSLLCAIALAIVLVGSTGCLVEDASSSLLEPADVQEMAQEQSQEEPYCTDPDGCCYSGGSCIMCRWPDGAGNVCCDQGAYPLYCCHWVGDGEPTCANASGS